MKIYCGGDYGSYPKYCEIDSDYFSWKPDVKMSVGFRIVRTITEENTDN